MGLYFLLARFGLERKFRASEPSVTESGRTPDWTNSLWISGQLLRRSAHTIHTYTVNPNPNGVISRLLGAALRGNSGVPSLRLPGTLWRERSERLVGIWEHLFVEQSHCPKGPNQELSSFSDNSRFPVPGSGGEITASP